MTNHSGVIYRERVRPSRAWWLILASLVAMISIAYGAALGTATGLAVAALFSIAITWSVYLASPLIVVDEKGLACGPALLPTEARGSTRIVASAELSTITRGIDQSVGDLVFTTLPRLGAQTGGRG